MSAETLKSLPRHMTIPFLLAGASLVAAATVDPVPARADDLIVKYDQSMLLKLKDPAAEIIIGNPTIADVSIQGGDLLVITGKSFGITNIIALDAQKRVIQDQRVMVQRDEVNIVNLTKGSKRESYNCSPQCNPTVTVGDDTTFFDNTTKSAERKMKFSSTDGEGGGGAGAGAQ